MLLDNTETHLSTWSVHPLLAGATAVLAVFLNTEECGCCGVGRTVPPKANVPLRTALSHAPASETSPQIKVYMDLTTALPPLRGSGSGKSLPYVNYNGSLTTPPCTEAVDWFLLPDPVPVESGQVRARSAS